MQRIWNKTFELLRDHPSLIWPVLAADILTFLLRTLLKSLSRNLTLWMTSTHSVLGGPAVPTQASYVKVIIVGGLITVLSHYLSILLYCAAFFAVADRVRHVLPQSDAGDLAGGGISDGHFRILRLSALATAALLGAAVPSIIFPLYLLGDLVRADLLQRPWVTPAAMLPFYMLSAYLLTPTALTSLKRRKALGVDKRRRHEARLAAFTAALVMLTIQFAVNLAPMPVPTGYAESIVRSALISLLGALPYIALFVAVAVIATGRGEEQQSADELAIDPTP